QDEETDTALRVVADHSRAVAFLIADGVLPSNEGRGYVLRRLIRRAFRFGRLIGREEPFLHEQCLLVCRRMGDAYPELSQNMDFMARVVRKEEEQFSRTLDKGLAILEEEMLGAERSGRTVIDGETAFKLYDTFGFPLDIVNDVAEKRGMSVDEAGFQEFMRRQKKQSKEAWSGSGEKDLAGRFSRLLEDGLETRFVGYEALRAVGRIVALMDENGETVAALAKGRIGYTVTGLTPFYGESGGQAGDTGQMIGQVGRARVTETLKPSPTLTVHKVEVQDGEILLDGEVELVVEEGLRVATARNHTCTHLLHAALRKVLGEHVKQAGSLVGPDRLRFDFTHIAAMTQEEISTVEEEVNRAILINAEVGQHEMAYDEAVTKGAIALFGEKYGDRVRVVEIEGESTELCGGTHLRSTGQAGSFCILSEGGIASGVRRIEAATGWTALNHWRTMRDVAREAAQILKARPDELGFRVRDLQAQARKLAKEIEQLQDKLVSGSGQDIMAGLEDVRGVKVLVRRVESPNMGALRKLMDDLRSRIQTGVVCLGAVMDDKAMLVLFVSPDLHGRFTAPDLIRDAAAEIGGSGGGRPDMAQAGGSETLGLERALLRVRETVAGSAKS
ncbi:MAG: alanine--tRNA ligase, partial [Deltaproteobacteria bacterium]|nr:alanine--tRNA ligase [Deltaproteobacteria bacterium]